MGMLHEDQSGSLLKNRSALRNLGRDVPVETVGKSNCSLLRSVNKRLMNPNNPTRKKEKISIFVSSITPVPRPPYMGAPDVAQARSWFWVDMVI